MHGVSCKVMASDTTERHRATARSNPQPSHDGCLVQNRNAFFDF